MSTNTNTFTVTDAKYLGSKIAADLAQLKSLYNNPTEENINKYIDEVVILLKDGYLKSIDYGFKRNGKWVLALCYEISGLGGIDNSPGRVPVGVDIKGASWSTYLVKSQKFFDLSEQEQNRIIASLPISRTNSPDAKVGVFSSQDKSYSSGSVDITRKIIK